MGHAAMLRNCSTFLDVTEDLTEFIRSTKGRPTDYREPLSKTATNAITCVMYSKKYDWDDKELSYISTKVRHLFHMLQGLEFSYAGTIFGLFMKIVHRGRHSSVLKAAEDCTALFERMAESRLRNGVSHQRQDFFDHFLSNHKMDVENNVSQKDRLFSIKTLASTTFNLVLGAADTTADTMYWALYFLAKHPTAQRKVQQELDDVIGSRAVAMADRTSLPYTAAFIEETLRMGCLLPLTATREAVTDTSISGIKVPKGSYIVPNIYSALNDETYFKKPDTFDPTRFLNDGKFVSIEANCQFTLGKRSCVGQTFARVELFVIFCSVLQNFKVTFPCDNYEVGHTAGTSRSLLPYQLCMTERSGRF
ncbi:Cytochrome P450 2J5 [Halotydeus destructor]|nr:Cytochrome P450 2J5 [Halotydeus destructor]